MPFHRREPNTYRFLKRAHQEKLELKHTKTLTTFTFSSFSFSRLRHYARVGYYRLVKPWVWRAASRRFWELAPPPREARPLFLSLADRERARLFIANDATLRASVLSQADEAARHEFAFFSETLRAHGRDINWHKDYVSGKEWRANDERAPLEPSHRIDFMRSRSGSDVKYTWELNRHHWFLWLGMARDAADAEADKRRYAEAFARDARSWMRENPLGFGVNWSMPMEVAIRACNWILAHAFFHDAPELDEEFWAAYRRTLWRHGHFLSHNLEYVRHNANHFFSNAMGLVALGAFFSSTQSGKRWLRAGKRHLEREIALQFKQDGVNFEKSTSYHCFVVEMALVAAEAAERVGSPFSAQYYERLTSALRYIRAILRPDGSAPAFGDGDNGRVFRPNARENFARHVHILALGAVFFNDPSLLGATNPIPAADALYACLFSGASQTGLRQPSETIDKHRFLAPFLHLDDATEQNAPSLTSASSFSASSFEAKLSLQRFNEGGYIIAKYILHSQKTAHFMMDVGDYGMDGWGGHGHNDCLSFELWIDGESVFTDSGTGCYTANPALRNELRATSAHNVVCVEGAEQVEWLSGSLWRIKRDTLTPKVLEARLDNADKPAKFRVVAEHSGYAERFGVACRRSVMGLLENEGKDKSGAQSLRIIDEIIRIGNNTIEEKKGVAAYHLAPRIAITEASPHDIALQTPTGGRVEVSSPQAMRIEDCRVSLFYGDVRPSRRICLDCSTAQQAEINVQWSFSNAG